MRLQYGLPCLLVLLAPLAGPSIIFAAAVEVMESPESYTLSNGVLTAEIAKHSGGLISLKYNGLETLDAHGRGTPGYWSHSAAAGKVTDTITIDPHTNGGQRGEVSIKGISGGAHGQRAGRQRDCGYRNSLCPGPRRLGPVHLLDLRSSAGISCHVGGRVWFCES